MAEKQFIQQACLVETLSEGNYFAAVKIGPFTDKATAESTAFYMQGAISDRLRDDGLFAVPESLVIKSTN